MTTVAYNHKDKELAVDSRMSRGTTICCDNQNKIKKTSKATFVLSGIVADINMIIHSFPENVETESNISGFVIIEDAIYWLAGGEDGYQLTEVDYNEAAGSGSQFAMGAMAVGATAKEAVQAAAKKDTSTGGRIRVLKLK